MSRIFIVSRRPGNEGWCLRTTFYAEQRAEANSCLAGWETTEPFTEFQLTDEEGLKRLNTPPAPVEPVQESTQ